MNFATEDDMQHAIDYLLANKILYYVNAHELVCACLRVYLVAAHVSIFYV